MFTSTYAVILGFTEENSNKIQWKFICGINATKQKITTLNCILLAIIL